MTEPIIIGLTAKLQCGKDTVFGCIKALAEPAGYTVHHVSFADPMKKSMQAIFGGTDANYFGTNEDKNTEMTFWKERLGPAYATYRTGLQSYGTELFRNHLHRDVWIWATELRIRQTAATGKHVFVAADVRFDNEAEAIREWGGKVHRLLRADGYAVPGTGISGHASEAGIRDDLVDATWTIELGNHIFAAQDILAAAGISTVVHSAGPLAH